MRTYTYPVDASTEIYVYFNRHDGAWWAFYVDVPTGYQIGNAWHDATREGCLIHRAPLAR